MSSKEYIMNGMRVAAVALAMLVIGCSVGEELDTQTFELKYIEVEMAARMIDPYVFGDRPDAPGRLSMAKNLLTVRETADNLEKIARVLDEYDKPEPSVRLRFQVIEANGTGTTDPAIADVEEALRELFRYEGYRLLDEAVMGGSAGSGMMEVIHHERLGGDAAIQAKIQDVRAVGDSGTVRLHVSLRLMNYGEVIETSINLRAGQTVVLGKARVSRELGTIILAVRPEFVRT
jgi:hypothetical protein